MKLLRLRLGFATNSSSTHSIVSSYQKGIGGFEHPMGITSDDLFHGSEFGWENFTLVSDEAKMAYFQQMLLTSMGNLPKWQALKLVEEITGSEPAPGGYIDHQSVTSFPLEWSGKGLSLPFLEEFKQALLDPRIMILGGNDNSDGHPLREQSAWEMDYDFNWGIARQEAPFVWTMFSRSFGHKSTYALLPDAEEPPRLRSPQLIDLKITDYCPYDCAFCYQGSTKQGAHMDGHFHHRLAYDFAESEVYEVALGGGEPTMHPRFSEILRVFADNGVVPNFTTKSVKWLSDEKIVDAVCKHAGGFAFSADKPEDIGRFVKKVKSLGRRNAMGRPMEELLTIHYVMGAQPFEAFEPMLRAAKSHGVTVTLLGFKTTHRGATYEAHPYDGWVDVMSRMAEEGGGWWVNSALPRTGIDTVLASQHRDEVLAAGIEERLVYFTEGTHSMYIDGVKKVAGVSSFADRYVPFESVEQAWRDIAVA